MLNTSLRNPTHNGCHAYMDIWPMPLIGDELILKPEPSNQYDQNAIAIIKEDIDSQKIVGHAPQMLSKILKMFVSLPEARISCVVMGKRVNRGGGYGLEIPIKVRLEGNSKAVAWAKKKIESLYKSHYDRVKKCYK